MAKILVISDFENYPYFESNAEKLQDIDFIISSGDLSTAYLNDVQQMLNKPLFFLHGNHVKRTFPHRKIKYIGNKTFNICGVIVSGIDGIEACNKKQIEKDVKKLLKKNKKIDVLVTHCPTKGLGDGGGYHAGSECFKEVYDKLTVKLHLYGHFHLNYGGTRELNYNNVKLINCYDHYIIEV